MSNTATFNPLSVILTSSGTNSVEPGQVFALGVMLSNRGEEELIAIVFIDNLPSPLYQWCTAAQEYLSLAPGQSGEVVFTFQIPLEALPQSYSFSLIVDIPNREYTPHAYTQLLQVVSPSQEVSPESDPTFMVEPASSVNEPIVLQRSEILPMPVTIYNRSDRVDRFRLRCMDLPHDWYRIEYPPDDEGIGLIVAAESLRLNPGDRGDIILHLHPPFEAIAGRYEPTIQIISENEPELGLFDVIYFQLQPVYDLQAVLQTIVGRAKSKAGQFEIWLDNGGNIERTIEVAVSDSEETPLCTYDITPNPIIVPPLTKGIVHLRVQPNKRWQRPWFGGDRLINLRVSLTDRDERPLTTNLLQGILTWAKRPFWQLLLLILVVLGVSGTLIWIIWRLFFAPYVMPTITAFAAEDTRYSAENGDTVRVSWKISDPKHLRTLRLVGRSPDGLIISGPIEFTFNRGKMPPELASSCSLQKKMFQCRNVRTDAREPGTYEFELIVVAEGRQGNASLNSGSDKVIIDPIPPAPQPQVMHLAPMQAIYQEQSLMNGVAQVKSNSPTQNQTNNQTTAQTNAEATGIKLRWDVNHYKNLRSLTLQLRQGDGTPIKEIVLPFVAPGRSKVIIPRELRAYCQFVNDILMSCSGFPTGLTKAGEYSFAMTAIALQGATEEDQPAEQLIESDLVKIQSLPPRLASFLVNGQPAQAKYLVPVDQGDTPPMVRLAWDVIGGTDTRVQLNPVPGDVPLKSVLDIPLGLDPGETTLTFLVTNDAGMNITRSLSFTVFDPTPTDPVAAAAEAIAQAQAAAAEAAKTPPASAAPGTGKPPAPAGFGSAVPSAKDQLSPLEIPPQFD
jgi:hypothetical protein